MTSLSVEYQFDRNWTINYLNCRIKQIKELLKEYPDSDTYKYCLKVWEERLAKYESGNQSPR